MSKKALFFDIDGTLYNRKAGVMKSTVEAIKKLKENGHLTFICTGRSRAMIPDTPILEMGFDGVVAACGTYGEFQNKVLFNKELDSQLIKRTIEILNKYYAVPIFEGIKHLYYDDKELDVEVESWYVDFIREIIGNDLLPIAGHEDEIIANKVSFKVLPEKFEPLIEELKESYHALRHDSATVELVPIGYSKGTGLKEMCKQLRLDPADTFAFGDSINDVEMLQSAGMGIVMGNGTPIAKKYADYVTSSLEDDGLYHALKRFELI